MKNDQLSKLLAEKEDDIIAHAKNIQKSDEEIKQNNTSQLEKITLTISMAGLGFIFLATSENNTQSILLAFSCILFLLSILFMCIGYMAAWENEKFNRTEILTIATWGALSDKDRADLEKPESVKTRDRTNKRITTCNRLAVTSMLFGVVLASLYYIPNIFPKICT